MRKIAIAAALLVACAAHAAGPVTALTATDYDGTYIDLLPPLPEAKLAQYMKTAGAGQMPVDDLLRTIGTRYALDAAQTKKIRDAATRSASVPPAATPTPAPEQIAPTSVPKPQTAALMQPPASVNPETGEIEPEDDDIPF